MLWRHFGKGLLYMLNNPNTGIEYKSFENFFGSYFKLEYFENAGLFAYVTDFLGKSSV